MDQLLDRADELTQRRGEKKGLATALGITPQRLNDWLSGRCKPSGEMTLLLLIWVTEEEASRGSRKRK